MSVDLLFERLNADPTCAAGLPQSV